MKKLLYFIIPIFIGGIFAFGLNKFLDKEISSLYQSKNLVPLMGEYASDAKDTGVGLNNHFLEQGDIMMIGASDFIHETRQHPAYFFNTNRTKNRAFTVGRSFTQEAQDAITIGSMDPNIKNKKVVLLVALSWFVYPNGINPEHFQMRFSPGQFYAFLNNSEISEENKKKLTDRVTDLLKGSDEYKAERLYAMLYDSDTFISKVEKVALYPYFKLREGMISLKEKGVLYKRLKKLKDKTPEDEKQGEPIDWKKEYDLAISDAKKRVGNNPFGVDQKYYDKTLKPKLKQLKNQYAKVDVENVKEIDDYKFFLDICEDLGIEPTIVIIPGLPKYYDYTGVTAEKREGLYNKISRLAEDKGFNVINTSDRAGELYYMRDVMHIGTKGWLDVSEKLYKQFNQGQVPSK
ncbi:D-alanyl-lipoteichoic acid biosynthesis protein DltD [Clostridium sardiniense]|uniref:Protein DltD n=1 Tax=Clostridium sardiniense TaxID=29369 RepID=A0ABS7KTJ3_CLOSR|nr:D-alanyl-lipoteichoic acid biosynthesis protein DltD [Clostridium sardiniense]MBY0753887.1 D-alanyl-lipoteichoic acid biosynthesis protein DltD [Clostridium sardiniense]MDQ0459598.1 D-alanine transfer protein [Clostridium sardiniense]